MGKEDRGSSLAMSVSAEERQQRRTACSLPFIAANESGPLSNGQTEIKGLHQLKTEY